MFFRQSNKNLIIKVNGVDLHFSIHSEIAKLWFLPRYRNGNPHEESVIDYIININDSCQCFFDIGSNVGFYSIFASKLLQSCNVHAFEVDPELTNEIIINARLNNINNIKIVNSAVWSKSGEMFSFQAQQENNKSTNIITESNQTDNLIVVSLSIDDYCRKMHVFPDIAKIDVEGAEFEVLMGMKSIIKTIKYVFLEVHPEFLMARGNNLYDIANFIDFYYLLHSARC